ncbi:MAG: hypothetical protein Q9163_006299 [Psora crenata]
MSDRHHRDGHGYFPNQLLNTSQPAAFSSSSSLFHEPLTSSHALPPIYTSSYASTVGIDPYYPSRVQLSPSSLLTCSLSSRQSGTFAASVPESSTHFTAAIGLPDQPPLVPRDHTTDLAITTLPSRPEYTFTAPPNLQLPKILPVPLTNTDIKPSLEPAPEGPASLAFASPPRGQGGRRMHVVGSQGKRRILPTAAGYPPESPASNPRTGKDSPALAKNVNGKYPCPHCYKPYLHAKHLKRHMLRRKMIPSRIEATDTGVRPYECALCHDTFSRSDILKRHFLKCSVRRGNPTGQSHLAYSRANKKTKQLQEESIAAGLRSMATEQLPSLPSYAGNLDGPIGLAGMGIDPPSYPERQEPLAHQVTRSTGIRQANSLGTTSKRDSTSSLNTSVFDHPNSAFSTGHVTPDSVTTSGAATPYTYPHEAKSSLNSPADGTFGHNMGIALGSSRLSTTSSYTEGTLPHIVGHPNGRGHEMDWSAFPPYTSNEEFRGAQDHPWSHEYNKPDAHFTRGMHWSPPYSKE